MGAPPGTPPDVLARLLAEQLAAAVEQPVIVENRPGAGGVIGLAALARAAPDGYTIGIFSMSFVVAPSLLVRLPYDIEKDFVALRQAAWNYQILAVPAASPLRSVADLVARARAAPGELKFASGGNGTPPHLAGELLKREAGVNLTHIPYRGATEAVNALLAGDVDLLIGPPGSISPFVEAGKLRALATSAPKRLAAHPDLPTFGELGYSTVQISDWQGFVAPAGTPQAVIARLSAEIAKATTIPALRARLEVLGMEPAGAGPEQFADLIRSEMRRWGKVVRDAGIQPN